MESIAYVENSDFDIICKSESGDISNSGGLFELTINGQDHYEGNFEQIWEILLRQNYLNYSLAKVLLR